MEDYQENDPPTVTKKVVAKTPKPSSIVTIQTVTSLPDGGTKSVSFINLEQCCICSTFYEQVKRAIPRPDLNRLICKLLEIQPSGAVIKEQSFFKTYIPICEDCTEKVRKYDRLRIEMDVLRNDVVSSVVDTLVHIRPSGNTPIHGMRNQIFQRWSAVSVRNSEVIITSGSPNPTKEFVINPIEKNQKGKHAADTIPVKLQQSASDTQGHGINEWVYSNLLEPAYPNTSTSNLGVAAEVTVPNRTECSITPEDSFEDDKEYAEEYFDDNENLGSVVRKKKQRRSRATQSKASENSGQCGEKEPKFPPYFCEDCGRVFGKWATEKAHHKRCNKDDTGRSKICPLCLEDFSSGSWQDLKKHFDDIHPNSEVEKCVTCRMDFLPTTLKDHTCGFKAVDYAGLESDFKCDLCEKAYVTRSNLTDHIRRAHKDEAKWSCEYCPKTYSSKMLLEQHSKSHRRIKTKYECKICGAYSTSAWGLKQHTRIHTGELPFGCHICDKAFRCGSVLKNHLVTHSKEKKFSCEICGMKFGLQGTMTRHWKRHQLPDTNYTKKCPICPNTKFKKVWVLKNHMKTQHLKDPAYEKVMDKYKDIDDRPQKQLHGSRSIESCDNVIDAFDVDNQVEIKVRVQSQRAARNKMEEKTVMTEKEDQDQDTHAQSDENEIEELIIPNFYENSDPFQKLDGTIYIADELDEENSNDNIDNQSDLSDSQSMSSPKRKRKSNTSQLTSVEKLISVETVVPSISPRVSPRRHKNPSVVLDRILKVDLSL